MRSINQILLTISFLLTSISLTYAQKKEPVLLLKEGKFRTVSNITEGYIEKFNKNAPRFKDKAYAVLQFESVPSTEIRLFLSKQGIELLEYIPEFAYTVSIKGKLNAGILQKAGARSLVELSPKQKMHPALFNQVSNAGMNAMQSMDVRISFPKIYKAEDDDRNTFNKLPEEFLHYVLINYFETVN